MLNECKEFEMYTHPKQKYQRLNHTQLKSFTGLSRPLSIIARYYMFLDNPENPNFELAENAMKAWFGSPYDIDKYGDLLQGIDSWFQKYTKKDRIPQNKYQEKKERFSYDIFISTFTDAQFNATNQIKYRSILSNAMQDGPLQRHYLVCNTDEDTIFKKLYSYNRTTGANKELRKEVRLKLLKIVSSYLLEANKTPRDYNDEYSPLIHLSKIDISNWHSIKVSNLFESITTGKSEVLYNYHPLIKHTDYDNNYNLYSFITSWIRQFHIIEESKLKEWTKNHPDSIFYSDEGLGNDCLKLNKQYK